MMLDIPSPDKAWDQWWAQNHPWDWWAKDRGGQPLPTFDRLLVAFLARDAYEAGKRDAAQEGK